MPNPCKIGQCPVCNSHRIKTMGTITKCRACGYVHDATVQQTLFGTYSRGD